MTSVSLASAAFEELYAAASVPTVIAEMEMTLTMSAGHSGGSPLSRQRRNSTSREKRPVLVDAHDLAPLLVADVADAGAAVGAGVVDQAVKRAAEPIENLLDAAPDTARVGDVQRERAGGRTARRTQLRGIGRRVRVDVGGDYHGTSAAKPQAGSAPQAAAGPGDQHHPTGDRTAKVGRAVSHGWFSHITALPDALAAQTQRRRRPGYQRSVPPVRGCGLSTTLPSQLATCDHGTTVRPRCMARTIVRTSHGPCCGRRL